MARIHELSNLLANQIAAGEVIERPASVVKELVENAIDAQASQVQVLVEDGGKQLIRVVDNGQGIEDEDIPLAFVRHATSKITSRHDLFQIMSLGFRGEALPSIAAVADVTLSSRTVDAAKGLTYQIKGGQEIEAVPANGRLGTVISVRDLFYNTPARLKYMKSRQTELAKIVEIVNRLALAYPQVAFQLTNDGKPLFQTTGNGNVQQVLASIYGRTIAQKLIPVTGESEHFQINGYVSLPEVTRSSRDYLTVLINHRYVKNFSISNAVIQGYGSKLMVGRFPLGVIDVTLDPLLVDVNVHPQKSEIRLTKEDELADLITQTIRTKLSQQNLIPDALDNLYGTNRLERSTANPAVKEPMRSEQSVKTITDVPTPPDEGIIQITKVSDLASNQVAAFTQRYQAETWRPIFDDQTNGQVSSVGIAQVAPNYEPNNGEQLGLDFDQRDQDFPHLDYIGQMHGTFLFAQSADKLYLVDQHAAQERINYEYYRKKIGEVTENQQQFLVPLILHYPTADVLKIQDHLAELAAVGIQLESFGPDSLLVREHTTWFVKGQEEATIREMIDWILREGSLTVAQYREKTAIMMSCKRAIKANMHLSDQQARELLSRLATCENPYNCPHGRPVLTFFTLAEMEKMFKRIQDSHQSWQNYDTHPF